jgi:hypothetical protein
MALGMGEIALIMFLLGVGIYFAVKRWTKKGR